MGRTNQAIIDALQNGAETVGNLARITGLNEASIRRSIQELRRDGFNISFGPLFRLG